MEYCIYGVQEGKLEEKVNSFIHEKIVIMLLPLKRVTIGKYSKKDRVKSINGPLEGKELN